MKIKHLLITTVLFFPFFTVEAQWSFGIQASKIKSWSSGPLDKPPKEDGFGAAISLYYRLGNHFQIGIEPGTAERSYSDLSNFIFIDAVSINPTSSFLPTMSDYGISVNSHWVVLPIMAKVDMPVAENKVHLFLKGGVGPSWLASAYREGGVFRSEVDRSAEKNQSSRRNRLEALGSWRL